MFAVGEIGAMYAFQQYGIIVFEQVLHQRRIGTRAYDVGELNGETLVPFITMIIIHFIAIPVEFRLAATAVFKTMQVNTNTCFLQCLQLAEKIKDATVVKRVWDIMANDMQLLFHLL